MQTIEFHNEVLLIQAHTNELVTIYIVNLDANDVVRLVLSLELLEQLLDAAREECARC